MTGITPRTFSKRALTLDEQIAILKVRGLIIDDEVKAKQRLEFIGYYRLSAYELNFQYADYTDKHHQFYSGTTFDDILIVYKFDRKLRLLVMDALERIEIAIKSVIINEMCIPYGAHWYLDPSYFVDHFKHADFMRKIQNDIDYKQDLDSVRNASIRHYFEHYHSPSMPPLWMIFESLSFGTVSVIFSHLKHSDQKRIATQFALGVPILKSWLQTMSYLRNLCAHNARLWNRVYTKKPKEMSLFKEEFNPNSKFYAQAVVLRIFLQTISPNSHWSNNLKKLLEQFADIQIDKMGFPTDWQDRKIWE
jgi:abortive infection bacteriophage resistance protein